MLIAHIPNPLFLSVCSTDTHKVFLKGVSPSRCGAAKDSLIQMKFGTQVICFKMGEETPPQLVGRTGDCYKPLPSGSKVPHPEANARMPSPPSARIPSPANVGTPSPANVGTPSQANVGTPNPANARTRTPSLPNVGTSPPPARVPSPPPARVPSPPPARVPSPPPSPYKVRTLNKPKGPGPDYFYHEPPMPDPAQMPW